MITNDDDILMRELEATAAIARKLEASGRCTHGFTQGASPNYRPDLAPGEVECLDCHRIFPSYAALERSQDAAWNDDDATYRATLPDHQRTTLEL